MWIKNNNQKSEEDGDGSGKRYENQRQASLDIRLVLESPGQKASQEIPGEGTSWQTPERWDTPGISLSGNVVNGLCPRRQEGWTNLTMGVDILLASM